MNIILAILLTMVGLSAPASAPASEPVESVSQVTSEPVDPALVPSIQATLGLDWVAYELALSGAVVPENVIISLTNESNCGAEISQAGMGGCTYFLPSGTTYITVSPALAWTAWGSHILHHELGHAVLNSHDECAVEAYAHQYTASTLWSYPECNTASH